MKILHPDSSWIGEALESVEGSEFDTRPGATPEEAKALHGRISDILRSAFCP